MNTRKLCIVLLLGSAGRAEAQAPGITTPRWLVGGQLGAYPRVVQPWDANTGNLARPWPIQLLGRYQTDRRGVEAGLLLRLNPTQATSYSDQYGTTTTHTSSRAWLLTLAGRYRLAPQQPARWRLDAEAGLMVISTRAEYTTTYEDARTGQVSAGGSGLIAYNDLPLLGGLGITYQLTPHLALTADARAGWSYIGTLLVQIFTRDAGFIAPLWPVCGVGASYGLGRQRGH